MHRVVRASTVNEMSFRGAGKGSFSWFSSTLVSWRIAPTWLFIAVLWTSSCRAETLVIPGSGNPHYLLTQLAQGFNASQSAHKVIIPISTGSAGAIRDVRAGYASIGRLGRPLKDEERASGLDYLPLGRDPVVFVGGAQVSLRNITRDQVFAIFQGRISDWSEIGGAPGRIRAIGREISDASTQGIQKELPQFGRSPYADSVKIVHLDYHLLELLDRYRFSLGFLNQSGLKAALSKLVRFDFESVAPTAENVASGNYPFWIEMGLVFKPASLTDAGRAFIAYIQSPEGSAQVRRLGILPPGGL